MPDVMAGTKLWFSAGALNHGAVSAASEILRGSVLKANCSCSGDRVFV